MKRRRLIMSALLAVDHLYGCKISSARKGMHRFVRPAWSLQKIVSIWQEANFVAQPYGTDGGTDFQGAAGPAIILVEPQLGENIGMVARAMANFGLSELRLVNPRDGWPSEKARAAASRADHVIEPSPCSAIWRRRSPTSISSSPPRRASATASKPCAARSRRAGRWGASNSRPAHRHAVRPRALRPLQ